MSDATEPGRTKQPPSANSGIDIVLPQQGLLYSQDSPDYVLCKPKLMPLKSVTLEKLEKMQQEAERKLSEMQTAENAASEH